MDIAVDSKGMAVLKVAIGKITKTVSTNKTVGYFEGLLNRMVYVSGIKVSVDKKDSAKNRYQRRKEKWAKIRHVR